MITWAVICGLGAVCSVMCRDAPPEAGGGPALFGWVGGPGAPPEAGGGSCDGHATGHATIVQHPAQELSIAIEVPKV